MTTKNDDKFAIEQARKDEAEDSPVCTLVLGKNDSEKINRLSSHQRMSIERERNPSTKME